MSKRGRKGRGFGAARPGKPLFEITYTEGALAEISEISAFHWKKIESAIDEQLPYQPLTRTRNRKPLDKLEPPWEHDGPTWELRVGDYRVYYDVDTENVVVTVRSVRLKPLHKTTDDIL